MVLRCLAQGSIKRALDSNRAQHAPVRAEVAALAFALDPERADVRCVALVVRGAACHLLQNGTSRGLRLSQLWQRLCACQPSRGEKNGKGEEAKKKEMDEQGSEGEGNERVKQCSNEEDS